MEIVLWTVSTFLHSVSHYSSVLAPHSCCIEVNSPGLTVQVVEQTRCARAIKAETFGRVRAYIMTTFCVILDFSKSLFRLFRHTAFFSGGKPKFRAESTPLRRRLVNCRDSSIVFVVIQWEMTRFHAHFFTEKYLVRGKIARLSSFWGEKHQIKDRFLELD